MYQKDRKLLFVPESASLDDIVHTLAKTHQHYFPVTDGGGRRRTAADGGRMVGIFSADDVRSWLYDDSIWRLANARDVMITEIVSVTSEDDLHTALRRFTAMNLDQARRRTPPPG